MHRVWAIKGGAASNTEFRKGMPGSTVIRLQISQRICAATEVSEADPRQGKKPGGGQSP